MRHFFYSFKLSVLKLFFLNIVILLLSKSLVAENQQLPDFFIIGQGKCGTTSLYNYINQHPSVLPAKKKEIRYFDRLKNFNKGLNWYKDHFKHKKSGEITGEASPHYLFSPVAYERIYQLLPQAKFIILLRNPIDRLYSTYQMRLRFKQFQGSFEKFIEICRWTCEGDHFSTNDYAGELNLSSGICKGVYLNQIEKWLSIFSKDQFLILAFEEFKEPQKMMDKVFNFLKIPPYKKIKFRKQNSGGKYPPMQTKTKKLLEEFYKPSIQNLEKFLGISLNWI